MTRVLRFVLALFAVATTTGMANAQTTYVTGSVTDAATGNGIVGASVVLRNAGGVELMRAVTGAGGSYRINGVAPGSYSLTAMIPAYSPTTDQITVVQGAPTMVSFVLQPRTAVLNVVTVTGSHGVAQKATDDPGSTFAVEEVEINTRASVSSTDHVVRLPGVDVIRNGLLSSNVVTRGFNNIFSGSLLTLTDYRFAFVPSLRVNVPYLNPTTNEDIARIEVVLGPAAALYGPNSANGVMHLITKSPFESQGTTLTVDAGNRSVLRTAIRHAGAPSERFGYKISFERFTGNDWESVDSVELKAKLPNGTPAPVQRSFDLEKWGGEARVDFRPRPGTDIIATVGRSTAVSALEPTGLGAAQVKNWVFDAYQLRASQGRLFGQVFMNTSDAGDTFILRNRNRADKGVIVDKSRQYVAQLQHGFGFGGVSMGAPSAVDAQAAEVRDRFDIIYGLDYQFTNPRTEGTINGRNEDDDNITEIGGYAQARTRITRLIDLVGALRVDDHSRTPDLQWSPRAAVIVHPTENQALRFTYNRAFSPPSTNNLFLDLVGGSIDFGALGSFPVRTVGTPPGGLSFPTTCPAGAGGTTLCLRSPFLAGDLPVDVRRFYPQAAGIAAAGGLGAALQSLAGLTPTEATNVVNRIRTLNPVADNAVIGTQLRVLNPSTGQFSPAPTTLSNIEPIVPTITNSYEVGYKGFIADRLSLTIDVWKQRRENFVGPLTVETPSAFLDAANVGAYVAPRIADLLTGASAAKIGPAATIIAGALGGAPNSSATGVPLGVVRLEGQAVGPTDIILAYRNYGSVDLWGSDLGAEFIVTPLVSVAGTYSWVDKDYFTDKKTGQPIALNAPAGKGSVTGRFHTTGGFSAELSNRWVKSFPALSGVYICNAVTTSCPEGHIPSYSVLDAQVSLRPSLFPNLMLTVTGTNMLDKEYQTFAGGARIGRLIMTRAQYTF